MMAQYNVTGKEGAHWPGARVIDQTCTISGEKRGHSSFPARAYQTLER